MRSAPSPDCDPVSEIRRGNLPQPKVVDFRKKLRAWYRIHKRDLPWRKSPDPYRVWLSEIMLQQTRVAAVIEHYGDFLRRFPSVQKLAAARQASVLAAWSGLGYYRRARMLHAAAKLVVREYRGLVPESASQLRELPGIGRYTAAAIASICFDEPVAVVDGNVERVLRRLLGQPLAGEKLWTLASALLDPRRPGTFNQAMMELGATVCTPRLPACLTCPVLDLCATRGEMPAAEKMPAQNKRQIHYSLIIRGGGRGNEVFLVQRDRNASLMAGMWELPERTETNGTSAPILRLRHSITVTDYTAIVWRGSAPPPSHGKWFAIRKLRTVALTGLARKILRAAIA